MMTAVTGAGGKALVRTNNITAIEGTPPKVFAVIAFDGLDQAQAWYKSDAMKESNEARHKGSKSTVFVVDGLAN
jgi:uncharacterized protein (DUF1330 family)